MTSTKNFYLSILEGLRKHSASKVAKDMKLSIQTLNYHLKKLKFLDLIEKVGYGTWEVKENNIKNLKKLEKKPKTTKNFTSKSHRSHPSPKGEVPQKFYFSDPIDNVKSSMEPDTVRSHAYHFVLKLRKNIKNWSKDGRRKYLEKKKIDFEKIHQGEQLLISSCTVWLTNISINIWLPHSFYVDKAQEGYALAVEQFLKVVKKSESLLRLDFRINGKHIWRVAGEHHALIMNALAREYNKKKEKLYIDDEDGIWAWIDDSEGLDEFETVLAGTKGRSANQKVKDWFNGIKKHGLTVEDVITMTYSNASQLAKYADEIATHGDVNSQIKNNLAELNVQIKNLSNVVGSVHNDRLQDIHKGLLKHLMKKVKSLDDVLKWKDYVSLLTEKEKEVFSEWLMQLR